MLTRFAHDKFISTLIFLREEYFRNDYKNASLLSGFYLPGTLYTVRVVSRKVWTLDVSLEFTNLTSAFLICLKLLCLFMQMQKHIICSLAVYCIVKMINAN